MLYLIKNYISIIIILRNSYTFVINFQYLLFYGNKYNRFNNRKFIQNFPFSIEESDKITAFKIEY